MTRRLRCELVPESPPVAAVLPIPLGTVKAHTRILSGLEDSLLELYVWAACERFEALTDYRLASGTYDGWLDAPASTTEALVVEIPLRPVTAVTEVRVYSATDVEVPVASTLYWTDLVSDPARVGARSGSFSAASLRTVNAIAVQFTAGYATVPDDIVRVIAQLAAAYWLNRGAEDPAALINLLVPWKRPLLA